MSNHMPHSRRTSVLTATMLAAFVMLCSPYPVVSAQDRDTNRDLFPPVLIGLELTEFYDEGRGSPHYGPAIQRLPVHRVTGVYSNGTDTTVLVRFVMSDPALTSLFSNPEHGALELAESAPGDLDRTDADGLTVYQGVRALDLGDATEESLQLVASLGGHAAIQMSTELPSTLTVDRMREALGELDVAAFQAAADAAAVGNEEFWRALALMPAELLGETRTMIFIDSDGQRRDRGVTLLGGYGGDAASPALILHVASFPEATGTTAKLRERYGIGPSDEPNRSVDDRPLFHLHRGEFDGAVALFDGSVVLALIPLAGQSPDLLADALVAIAPEQ